MRIATGIAVIFVSIVLEVECFRTLDQWNSLFHSDARAHFTSDGHLSRAHDQFMSHIKHDSYEHTKTGHPFIVQFKDNCGIECHSALKESVGSKNHQIISPAHAQIISTVEVAHGVKSSLGEFVVDVAPMLPSLKIEKNTHSLMNTCGESSLVDLLVMFGPMSEEEVSVLTETLDSLSQTLSGASVHADPGGLVAGRENVVRVTVPCDQLGNAFTVLSKLPQCLWIEEQEKFVPHNRWASGLCQSGLDDETPLYEINITGSGHIIGVSDTGIDMSHCHFYDPDVSTPYDRINTNHRKVVYYNSYADKIDDSEGHGTHVSSSAAGRSLFQYGDFQKYDGNARDAKIAFFDIGETGKDSLTVPSDINNGLLVLLYDAGARVSTHSWGARTEGRPSNNGYTMNARAVDSFMRSYPDTLVFFAGGNEGIDVGANSVGSPATNKNGVCVGASLNSHDSWRAVTAGKANKNQYSEIFMAGFSSEGPTQDGRLKPDIAAPGWVINAAKSVLGGENGHCAVVGNQGTSMASPTAAGNALLVMQYFSDGWYPSGSRTAADAFVPSGALVKAMIYASGESMEFTTLSDGSQVTTGGYPSNKQGYGRMQLQKVLNFADSSTEGISLFVRGAAEESSPYYVAITSESERQNYTFTTSLDVEQDPIRVTLCYTDEIGSVGASVILVNDLSMDVTGGGESFPPLNEADRHLNNMEMTVIDSPQPNTTYTVSVFADSLSSVQPYGLVIVGSVTVAAPNQTVVTSNRASGDSSNLISPAVMDIIYVLGITVVCMGILLSIISVQMRPNNKLAREEARHVEMAQRMSAQEAYRSDVVGNRPMALEHRDLTQAELNRISGIA